MITAQGCSFRCSYCPTDRNLIFRTAEDVINEIDECVNKYGFKEILIYDETFTLNQERAMKVCDGLIERGINKKLVFAIRTRADCVSKELIDKLAEAGCIRINFGIETSNEEALRKMNRYLPQEKIKQAVKWAKDAGIEVLGFFIFGTPGETEETLQNTIDFAKELKLDFAQFNKLTLLPDTELLREEQKIRKVDYWERYSMGEENLDGNELRLSSCKVKPEDLDKWLKKAYRQFYFRPAYILQRVKKLESFGEFKNMVKSALSLI